MTADGCGRYARALRTGLLAAATLAGSARAAELIVVDQAGCPYCERFEREIAPAWPNTKEGRDTPLRRVDLHGAWPADLDAVEPATVTPTFILVEDGIERGRLVGYAGDDHFWFLVGRLLDSPPAEGGTGAGTASGAPTTASDDTRP